MSQSAGFDLSRNPWFAAGGVYAVAHVRGGGELGDDWRRAGKGDKKQNGIDDFVACADYIVAQRYTSSAKLAAKGTSAGGVVVGSALTQRPELFRAVIIEVGCLDALRFEVTRNGPPNVHEWGSVKTQEGFHALRAMSPYEHVVPGTAYPAVLLTAGINDPRVDVWQPAKMAARLRAASTSGRPILLAVNYDEGHFHTTLSSFNQHHADAWAFLLWQLGEVR
jgi:prolyl oligopeptidase